MKNRAVLVVFVVAVLLLLVGLETALAAKGGQGPQINTRGVPLYVIIEVEWNAAIDLSEQGSWTVWKLDCMGAQMGSRSGWGQAN